MMRPALWALLLPFVLAAQSGGRVPGRRPGASADLPALQAEDLGAVEGQVVNAITGEPLKNASLTLRRTESARDTAGLSRSYNATSDAAGRFVIPDVAPGKYRLSATRTGFVDAEYGSRDPQRGGTTQSLDPGKRLVGLQFRLMPHGVLAGRITDEDGEPIQALLVQALRYRYSQGRKQLFPYGAANTNDLGEYRIYGLPPGRYYISVSPRRSYVPERTLRGAPPPVAEYVPTYYSGTIDPAAATPIEVGPGIQLRGLDLMLARCHTVRLQGQVTDATGSGGHRLIVYLVAPDAIGYSSTHRATLDLNGHFEIRGVTPGPYTLVAAIPGRGSSPTARLALQVGNSDLENVSISVNPLLEVSGRIRIDGQTVTAPNFSSIQVNLRGRDASGVAFGPSPTVRIREDGGFTLPGVNPDRYNLLFSGLPEGFYVKAVLSGGQDTLAAGLDLSGGISGPLDVVLSPNAGQITGTVQNDEQQPAAGATVALIPQEKERRDQPQYYKTAATDPAGRFTLKNVNPGQYKIYAWEDLESGAYLDPDFVKPFEARGASITTRESSQEDVLLRLIR